MQLTLHRTLLIHTLLLVGIGGYLVSHRRVPDKTVPVKHVRMPTQAELLEIERLGAELRGQSAEHLGGLSRDPEDLDRRYRHLIDLQLGYMLPEHPEVVNNRKDLARVLKRKGAYAEAAEQYRILLKVYQRVMGTDDPDTLSCQKDLKEAMWHVTQAEEAEQRLREEYKRQSVARGKEDGRVLMIQAKIADQLMNQSKCSEAEGELRAMVNILLKKQENTFPPVLLYMVKLIMCLEVQGKRKEALEFVQEMEWLQADTPGLELLRTDGATRLRAEINSGRLKPRMK
ncbi:MAG: tetratricopeptide repeat protein [Verrucomicrobia bacterium]|nr:tetratricopeptide repeat protein [Verrucomicrobiota bacterium]